MQRKLYDEPVLEIIDIKYDDVICNSGLDTDVNDPFGTSGASITDF